MTSSLHELFQQWEINVKHNFSLLFSWSLDKTVVVHIDYLLLHILTIKFRFTLDIDMAGRFARFFQAVIAPLLCCSPIRLVRLLYFMSYNQLVLFTSAFILSSQLGVRQDNTYMLQKCSSTMELHSIISRGIMANSYLITISENCKQ